MKHIDLFSGIGGFSYALDTIFYDQPIEHTFVEFNEYCQAVLRKHWPQAIIHGDIRTFTNTRSVESRGIPDNEREEVSAAGCVDFLTGGFPCQPFSAAGRRRGTADDRYLWPEMFRVIQDFKPEWVVAENVRGLVTWNDGMVLEQVCADLESKGYEVQPLIIPAVAVNAPHRRDRVWIIANRSSDRRERGRAIVQDEKGYAARPEQAGELAQRFERPDSNAADTRRERWEQGADESVRPSRQESERANCSQPSWNTPWLEVATRLCSVDDGLPGRMGNTTISRARHRKEQLKAYGNAIVPQVAMEIFQSIKLTYL